MPAVVAGDRAIVRDGIGLGTAVGIFGLSFGALAVGAGLSTAQTCVLSLAMFTGGSQLAYVGVLRAGGGVGSAAASALLLGTRNALYGVTLGPLLRLPRRVRPVAAHWVIDETTAMATGAADAVVDAVAGPTHRPRLAFAVTGAAVFSCWNLATLAGALLGRSVADPGVLGLDAVGLVCAGCYVEKLLGMLVPASTLLRWPLVDRLARRLPAALLAALVVTGAVVRGHSLVVDARLAGLAVAVVLLVARAPLVLVVVAAAVTAAGLRLLG